MNKEQIEEIAALRKRIAEIEESELQLMEERDNAEEALADMYRTATGEAPEWSNWFGFSDAVDAVEGRIAELEKRVAKLETDCWTYENTVKNLLERAGSAESACLEAVQILNSGERMALTRAVNILLAAGEDTTHYQYLEAGGEA